MPTVSVNSKSFLLPMGRGAPSRFSIVGASFDAALINPEAWSTTLALLRHTGFNTVVIRAPWILHEPTPDHFVFTEECNLRRAVLAAGAIGLRVIVRIGPCVGGSFARGGLPSWVGVSPTERVREAEPAFLARVTKYWRELAAQFVDLQAARVGAVAADVSKSSKLQRPIIAVGLEDDWRCLDAEVGGAYFSALVRFAREVGIEVPLFTANNCWYSHGGTIDAWRGATHLVETVAELKQVHPDTPTLLLHPPSSHDRTPTHGTAAAESIAARTDFVCEVVGTRHRSATSARGQAELDGADTHTMRRALVFASTMGEVLAGMTPTCESATTDKSSAPTTSRTMLRGPRGQEITVVVHQPKNSRATASSSVEFYASNLLLAGATLERCTGSIVALLGDILCVTGSPRSKISLKVDGSDGVLTVPAEGIASKLLKVRGLRFAAVAPAFAEGVGVGDDALEFVDDTGALRARLHRDGSITRVKARTKQATPSSSITLSEPRCVVEHGLLDGTHPRFAPVTTPRSLGAYGVQSMHGYYSARCAIPKRKDRALWFDGRGIANSERVQEKSGSLVLTMEARADFSPTIGGHGDEQVGVVGALYEVAPLRGVKAAIVDLPRFDATRLGRFVWGYDARDDAGTMRTVRWTIASRATPIVLRLPSWWFEEGHGLAHQILRLNDSIVLTAGLEKRDGLLLDGALLHPMRPTQPKKGEKPAKGKAITFEPVANQLVLDLDPRQSMDERVLQRLAKETAFLEVCSTVDARWAFARVQPPASWTTATAAAVARKPSAAPAWFRMTFDLDTPRTLTLTCTHAHGAVGTILVNGVSVLVLDGVSGVIGGTARKRVLTRSAAIAASNFRSGENELCLFTPDGVLPALVLQAAAA